MITVSFKRARSGRISSVEVSGHGNYGDSGQDIVCAGISMLTITILNGLTEIVGLSENSLEREVRSGYTSFVIPEISDSMTREKVNVLMNTYELGVKASEAAYSDYVHVIDNTGGENND